MYKIIPSRARNNLLFVRINNFHREMGAGQEKLLPRYFLDGSDLNGRISRGGEEEREKEETER